jgi:hypothetical protein
VTLNPRPLLVDRSDLTACAWLAAAVADDDREPDDVRQDVRDLLRDMTHVLLYGEPGGGRSIKLIPVGFRWPGFFVDMVAEFLVDLDDEVKAERPAQVHLAQYAATLVDREGFSIDFRLDSLDALNVILASLRGTDDQKG